ncbi:MAG: hypothetical protein IMZ60_04875 [Actinobacteria bacterium]|nr:hypothetical protein [Chloroflexota bacterium]MBE3128995.1 hypothetical protein [Actinomycetota bacterium]
MNHQINLIDSLRKYKRYLWIFIAVVLLVFIGGLLLIKFLPVEEKFISSSKFEVVNGENTYNLYLGVYHRITAFEDVASVLRSNELLREVIKENNLTIDMNEFRQNIDLYQEAEHIYTLELVNMDKEEGEAVNLSIINNYLKIIESRMDNDNRGLFDVKVLQDPVSKIMDKRIAIRMMAAFLFSIFCGIIINSGIIFIKRCIDSFSIRQKKRNEGN